MKVFLGGTCNESKWRDELIPNLKIDYFNPVVEDWTEDCMVEERRQREECDLCLYVITPRMIGVFSIAEVVDDVNRRPEKVVFTVLRNSKNYKTFSDSEFKSLKAVSDLVERRGGVCFSDLATTENYLNHTPKPINTPSGVKTLHNSTVSGARVNVKDIKVVGNGDMFRLLCKASSENEGWMKSTKAMQTPMGCLVQVTTQQKNLDGSYAVAEALSFVPGAVIVEDENNGRKLSVKSEQSVNL